MDICEETIDPQPTTKKTDSDDDNNTALTPAPPPVMETSGKDAPSLITTTTNQHKRSRATPKHSVLSAQSLLKVSRVIHNDFNDTRPLPAADDLPSPASSLDKIFDDLDIEAIAEVNNRIS